MKASWALYLILDSAGVVDYSHTGGIGSNIQPLDDFGEEDLDLLKFWRADAPTAVDDEHNVCGASFAQTCRCTWRDRKEIIMYSHPNSLHNNCTSTKWWMDKEIKLMKKGEKGGGWEEHRENGGIERKRGWRLVRKWEETEKQDTGRQQGWREARVEGEMEKCLARKTRMKDRERSNEKPLALNTLKWVKNREPHR